MTSKSPCPQFLPMLFLLLSACASQPQQLQPMPATGQIEVLEAGVQEQIREAEQSYQDRYVALSSLLASRLTASGDTAGVNEWLAAQRALAEAERTLEGLGAAVSARRPSAIYAEPVHVMGQQTLDRIEVSGSRIVTSDQITNTQEAGIDEGDLVKKLGDFLIVLRNNALYSVRMDGPEGEALQLVHRLQLVPDGDDPDAWFDELLTFDDGILVLAFNYEKDCTELRMFTLDANGQIHPGPELDLRTDDYFTEENVGARIFQDRLLLNLPVSLDAGAWPGWRNAKRHTEYVALLGEQLLALEQQLMHLYEQDADEALRASLESDLETLYSAEDEIDDAGWILLGELSDIMLPPVPPRHAEGWLNLSCGLKALLAGTLDCQARGVVTDGSPVVYTGPTATWLHFDTWAPRRMADPAFARSTLRWWQSEDMHRHRRSLLYRIPHDGSAPGAALLPGSGGNQFWMREDQGRLRIAQLLASSPEQRSLILLVLEPAQLGDHLHELTDTGRAAISLSDERPELRLSEQALWVVDRGDDSDSLIHLAHGQRREQRITLAMEMDRLELLDHRVLLTGYGNDDSWMWQLAEAPRGRLRLGPAALISGYDPAESRSQSFNHGPVRRGGYWLGLPGVHHELEVADLLYAPVEGVNLGQPLVLSMQDQPIRSEEGSEAAEEWYGATRLFFIDGRAFGLSADLLKEAELRPEGLVELRRVELR